MSDAFSQASDPSADFYEDVKIGEVMGLDGHSQIQKYKHQIERVKQWAKAQGAESIGDAISKIKELAGRLGAPTMENWAQHLSNYAYLSMERDKLDTEIKKIEPKVEDGGHKDSPDIGAGKAQV